MSAYLVAWRQSLSCHYVFSWSFHGGCMRGERERTLILPFIRTLIPICCSVAKSCLILQPHSLQHARLPCPSLSPGVCLNPCPLSQWCHPTTLSLLAVFSSCPQSFPPSGSFKMNHLFASGGQSIGVSASTSVLPVNTQDPYPLGWTGWISLQSKGLTRVFSSTTIWKHPFFGTQCSLWSNSLICTWLLEKT